MRGIDAVTAWCQKFQSSAGSLTPAPGAQAAGPPMGSIKIPQPLLDWLLDRLLLRGMPLCYLVPDAQLLPAESIRVFHVNPTWIDRLIDGVFAAADLGTVEHDLRLRYPALAQELPVQPGRLAGGGYLLVAR